MKKSIVALVAAAMTLGMASPSFADMGGDAKSFAGATTAVIVDVPQGMVVDGLWRSPKSASHALAGHFGDENGLGQRLAGLAIGIPFGVVWGIPTGGLHGWHHGRTTGWEKPFSTESFIVSEKE